MSRPFSYNDENFTIIGNVLFVHIKITKVVNVGSTIIEIPPAIYARMYQKSIMAYLTSTVGDVPKYVGIGVAVRKFSSDGKYYLYSGNELNYIPSYLVCYFNLKDI